ncbi:MAG: hypothetical protein WBO45_26140, partial [Planctomycetota bacterium]
GEAAGVAVTAGAAPTMAGLAPGSAGAGSPPPPPKTNQLATAATRTSATTRALAFIGDERA